MSPPAAFIGHRRHVHQKPPRDGRRKVAVNPVNAPDHQRRRPHDDEKVGDPGWPGDESGNVLAACNGGVQAPQSAPGDQHHHPRRHRVADPEEQMTPAEWNQALEQVDSDVSVVVECVRKRQEEYGHHQIKADEIIGPAERRVHRVTQRRIQRDDDHDGANRRRRHNHQAKIHQLQAATKPGPAPPYGLSYHSFPPDALPGMIRTAAAHACIKRCNILHT